MANEEARAIEDIRVLKARYFRFMDQKRWDEWEDLFTEDVVAAFPQDGGIHEGAAAFRAHVEAGMVGAVSIHHGHGAELELTGPNSASGVWAMEDHIDFAEGDHRRHLWGTGWYHEEYQRGDDGRWRISRLELRRQRVEVDGVRIIP